MILLIGGPPKCGKTTLAKQVSKKTGFSYISTDTLQCVARAYINQSEIEDKFPCSFKREDSNDIKYNKYSAKEIVEDYIKQGQTVYDAIDVFIECEILDENDYIIEGYHITPELVYRLIKKYGDDQIEFIFLIKTNAKKFVENIKNSKTPNDWIIKRTNNENTFNLIASMVCRYGRYFKHQARSYGFFVSNMDEDFENRMAGLISLITR